MTAPDRRNGDNRLVFPEADNLAFGNSSWSDFGSASKDFTPQIPRRQAPLAKRGARRRNSMVETYSTHSTLSNSHSGAFGSDVFGSDVLAADPWVDFQDGFGMSNYCKDRDDSFNTNEITSESSEEERDLDDEEEFILHFPSTEGTSNGEVGTMPLRDHNLDKAERNRSRLASRGREGRRSPRPPSNEGPKRRNRSRSKPSFVASRRARSLSVPKRAPEVADQEEKSSSSHSRKIPSDILSTKGKKHRSKQKPRKAKSDTPKMPSDKSRKTHKTSKDKSLKTSKDKSQKILKASSDKSSRDRSSKLTKASRSKSPKSRDKSDKSPKALKSSRSKSPRRRPSRSKSPMAARDKSSKTPRSRSPKPKPHRRKSPMTARDRSSKTSRSKSPKASRSKSPGPSRDTSSKISRDTSSKISRDRSLKANSVGMEKKKALSLFSSPLTPKSYLSRGTQKRCYAGVSKASDRRQNNIKESLANVLCDEGSSHSERKRSSSVPRRSGSDSSRSEQMENQHVPVQRLRRNRRHSLIA